MKVLRYLYIFILGFVSFYISQILLRVPILNNYVYKSVKFSMFQFKHILLAGILITFSAGVFEECFRFIIRKFLIKNSIKIGEPIIFGLGHSMMEIAYLFLLLTKMVKLCIIILALEDKEC